MTDYKYRVLDGNTGKEFADVATLKLALDILPALREFYPQVTIDEIVPESKPNMRTPIVGDTVRTGSGSAGGSYGPGKVGELLEIDDSDTSWPYRVRTDRDLYGVWFSSVEPA